MTQACILHNLLCLFLCIETTIGLSVINIRVMPHDCTCAFGANLCQFWVLLYLKTPPLIIGKMPMEDIHVVKCQ